MNTRAWVDEWVLLKVLALSFAVHVALVVAWPEAAPRLVQRPAASELTFFEAPIPPPEPVTAAPVKPAAPVKRSIRVAPRKEAPAPTATLPIVTPTSTPLDVVPVIQLPPQSTSPTGTFAVPPGARVGLPTGARSGPGRLPNGGGEAGLNDEEPIPLGEVLMPFPSDARARGIEGPVRLRVTIDARGAVQDVVILSGPGFGLDEAARDALKRFKFKPATRAGQAVGSTFVYTYSFLLD